jgi:hypothetical protein
MGEIVPIGRAKPLHDPWEVEEQYRLKVQRFSHLPPELSVRKVLRRVLPGHAAHEVGR